MSKPAPAFDPAAIQEHTAILGKTGSGKTNTAKVLVEQVFHENHRVCILDPIKSDWRGLVTDKSGKGPGLPFYILGGRYGHVPLTPDAGATIGHLVGQSRLRHSLARTPRRWRSLCFGQSRRFNHPRPPAPRGGERQSGER